MRAEPQVRDQGVATRGLVTRALVDFSLILLKHKKSKGRKTEVWGSGNMLFGPEHIACTRSAFQSAERLTGRHFGFGPDGWLRHPYDVRTLALLREHEVNNRVFAQLCRYGAGHPEAGPRLKGSDFYRVCIQDNRVLDAVHRSGSFIRLVPLMLYIAVHELVHIVRFCRGESDFDMPLPDRTAEEKRVHEITRQVLRPVASPELDLVLQCFSDDYVIEGMYN